MVESPFAFGDGDTYSIYLEELPSGGVRITDAGQTLMHLSYSMDVDSLKDGTRGALFEQIIAGSAISERDGELFVDSPIEQIGRQVFVLGQAITRVHDLTFLRRLHVASTFYEDLAEALTTIVPAERIHRNHVVQDLPKAENYPVDFYIEATDKPPLFLFGVPSRDKAKLTTIILQHMMASRVSFESLLVFLDQQDIPRGDLARLTNVGGEMIASLDADDDLRRKVLKLVA